MSQSGNWNVTPAAESKAALKQGTSLGAPRDGGAKVFRNRSAQFLSRVQLDGEDKDKDKDDSGPLHLSTDGGVAPVRTLSPGPALGAGGARSPRYKSPLIRGAGSASPTPHTSANSTPLRSMPGAASPRGPPPPPRRTPSPRNPMGYSFLSDEENNEIALKGKGGLGEDNSYGGREWDGYDEGSVDEDSSSDSSSLEEDDDDEVVAFPVEDQKEGEQKPRLRFSTHDSGSKVDRRDDKDLGGQRKWSKKKAGSHTALFTNNIAKRHSDTSAEMRPTVSASNLKKLKEKDSSPRPGIVQGGSCSQVQTKKVRPVFVGKRGGREAEAVVAGYLWKKGEDISGRWKKRFFRLTTDSVSYFAGQMEEGGQLKGEFPVNKITNIFGKVSYSDRKKSYGFQLLVVKSNGEPRVFCLAAESEATREEWVTGLLMCRPKWSTGSIVMADNLQYAEITQPIGGEEEDPHGRARNQSIDVLNKSGQIPSEVVHDIIQRNSQIDLFPGEIAMFGMKYVSIAMSSSSLDAVDDEQESRQSVRDEDDISELCYGYLMRTNYRLIFIPFKPDFVISVPLPMIRKLMSRDKKKIKAQARVLDVICVDFRMMRLVFPANCKARRAALESLRIKENPEIGDYFASYYKSALRNSTAKKGWESYEVQEEFRRMGVNDSNVWIAYDQGQEYGLCKTYPRVFYILKSMVNSLPDIASYRSKGRVPALSWISSQKAALLRCSQPGAGVTGKRSTDDETYLLELGKGKTVYIVDARSKAAATANAARGGGRENAEKYGNVKILFMNIENIHAIRHSYQKLYDSLRQDHTDQEWPLASNEWLGHIKGILQGAVRIARVMEQGNSVVVHCSDGWDRTPQLTGMAQIMMDSYFRTLRGFITLVDKEWCSFGHKFADRCLVASDTNSEWSPIFMQFLDCVYQMYAQYPTHFEFSSKLLVFLCDETYAGRFGTFMCNSEKERLDQRLHVKTISVWTYVMGCEETFQNPLFDKETLQVSTLLPSTDLRKMEIWKDYYLRYL